MHLQQCKEIINRLDGNIQKFVKMNGGHVKNPKEESFCQTIRENYDKAEKLQAEKIGLSEKAVILVSLLSNLSSFYILLIFSTD